ncbi:CpaF family protein OS=Streptomyces tendae OX=1932 GN=GUR47_18000 PE=3 SV=1 [Streptomyces tendae]
MLVAGAVNFVVFVQRRNDFHSGARPPACGHLGPRGQRRRRPGAVQRVLAETPDGQVVPHAPIACLEDLIAYGYRPNGTWG